MYKVDYQIYGFFLVRLGWNYEFSGSTCVSHVVEMITNSN